MAGEVVTLNTIENEVSSKIDSIIAKQDGWSDEDKLKIKNKYMQEYGAVLREMVPLIEHLLQKPVSEHPQSPNQPEVESKEKDIQETLEEGCESLEDIEIRHEGTLLAVTKKRKEYPAYIAGLMGKTIRLQKNTVEALKVTLPPRAALEIGEGADQLDERFKGLMEEIVPELSQSSQSIQQHTHHLTNLAHVAQVVLNNQHHPIEALLASHTNSNAR